MAASKMDKSVLDDMQKTITELQSKNLVRNYRGVSNNETGRNIYEISFPGKNNVGSIVYDKHVSGEDIMNKLLEGLQYTVLLYDKSIIQAEFTVEGNDIIKERLVFMKKHNKIWDRDEIEECDILEEDWFSEEKGVPIMLRIDYAPDEHKECEHAATHLTLSNHESCRIPIKGIVTFSEFIRFIMIHFYNIHLDIKECRPSSDDTITELEKKMMHISWN